MDERTNALIRKAAEEAMKDSIDGAVVTWEIECLWHDLGDAVRHALNGYWSIAAESVVGRLVFLIRTYPEKAPNWRSIPTTVLIAGWFDTIMTAIGVPYERPDLEEVHALLEESGSHG